MSNVTYVPNIRHPGLFYSVAPQDIFTRIQEGFWDMVVNRWLQAEPEHKRSIKSTLPAVCWNGLFQNAVTNAGFVASSGLVTLDFDDVDEVEHLLSLLEIYDFIMAAFASPSGRGVKAFAHVSPYPTTPILYAEAWRWVKSFLEVRSGYDIDGGSDVRRLCFCPSSWRQEKSFSRFSHDTDITRYPTFQWAPKTEGNYHIPKPPRIFGSDPGSWEVSKALEFIPSDDYDIWIKVGLALKASGLPEAELLWDSWSSQSTKYDPVMARKKWLSFSAQKITIATIFWLARQYGFRGE